MSDTTQGDPEARAVCEHFYASHCYRDMSIRLCMTCHEPDWDDLAEQLAGAATIAAAVPVPGDASRALPTRQGQAQERAAASLAGCPTPCDDDCELNPDGCHESHQPTWKRWHDPGWSCGEVQRAIAEAVSAERDRAEAATARAAAAEAKLAEIAAYIEEHKGDAGFSLMHAWDILTIIDGEPRQREEAPFDRDFAGPVL